MKIGIDARLYGPKHGGIGRYIENLIKQLEKLDQQHEYFIFLSAHNLADYQPINANFKKVLADIKVYSWQEQLLLPILLKRYHLDLVHFTHFNAPIFYGGKYLVTIHDLIISHYPSSRATTLNPILYSLKLFLYKLVVKVVAHRALKIMTVSNYSKKDIMKLLSIASSKILVTYEGVDLPIENQLDGQALKSTLGIDKDFIMYVGSAYPHKNLDTLIVAFQKVLAKNNNLQLVLVGHKNYFYQRLEQEIDQQSLATSIILTGYLSDEELSCLYQSAKLYLFPSLIEGFGLPPLEAQSYGLPVLSSSATCLPEILGDSVLYFDPKSSESIANLIRETLNNHELMSDLRQRGFDNQKRYSWIKCATETWQEYQKY